MDYLFDTPSPVRLHVELGRGSVTVRATDTTTTEVTVTGPLAEDVVVEHRGDEVDIVGPKERGSFSSSREYADVTVTVPVESTLSVRTGSADVVAEGVYGHAVIQTGSGDVALGTVRGEARLKTGSGTVDVLAVDGNLAVTTGSGDVRLARHGGAAIVKTGSGSAHVAEAGPDLAVRTGSGTVTIDRSTHGRLSGKSGSGDVRVAIPAGTPVWTDLRTGSGRIRSDLPSTGAPQEGQEYVELRATTGSGDIVLARTE